MKVLRWLAITLLVAVVATTFACNTFKGVGQDVEKGGQKIQKAADSVKGK